MKMRILTIQLVSTLVAVIIFSLIVINIDSSDYLRKTKSINMPADGDLVHLKTAKLIWPEHFILALATELGYMKEEGIVIDYIDDSYIINESLESLMDNKIDFTIALVSDYYIEAKHRKNSDPKIIFATNYSNGNDVILARKNGPSISEPNIKKTLAGNEDFIFFIKYALRQLNADENTIINVDTRSERERIDKLNKG